MSTRHVVEARWVVESDEGLSPDEVGKAVDQYMTDHTRTQVPEVEVSLVRYASRPEDAPEDWKQPKVSASVSLVHYQIEGGLEL